MHDFFQMLLATAGDRVFDALKALTNIGDLVQDLSARVPTVGGDWNPWMG